MNLRELAKLCGVSPATISRVLHNNPNVSEENRARVLEAVRQTGYTLPEKHEAQPIILAIYGRMTFWEVMYQSISMEAKKLGYTFLSYCVNPEHRVFRLRDFEKDGMLDEPRIAGILLSAVELDAAAYKRLRARYPVVFCGNPIHMHGGCAVSTDDFHASYTLIEQMIAEGGRRFCILKAKEEGYAKDVEVLQMERIAGAGVAMQRHGLPQPVILAVEDDEDAERKIDGLLASADRPDTFFCLHGMFVVPLIAYLESQGLRVPEDVRVCGYDVNYFPRNGNRKVWYVRQDFAEIGRESVRMLDGLIHGIGRDGKRLYLDGEIRRR